MDVDLPRSARDSSTTKTSHGCWTCKVRRKKCDGNRPVCDLCATLHITCHHDQDKPEWMDGGRRQEEMAEQLKYEVKGEAHRRRGARAANIPEDRVSAGDISTGEWIVLPAQRLRKDTTNSKDDNLKSTFESRKDGSKACIEPITTSICQEFDRTPAGKAAHESLTFGRSDTILMMFYLEHLLPFLFPFYHPSLLQGGKSWLLEMMIRSPVIRQATLCQSSYFFSLAREQANHDEVWETVLIQTRDAFEMLRRSLQYISGCSITEHLPGAVRILASIMQLQRFEIAVLSFSNCHAHLNAAVALFQQLLHYQGQTEPARADENFRSVMNYLGPSSWVLSGQYVQTPSAEQAAFRFSSALLILDDIIAATVLQQEPSLYGYHHTLLNGVDKSDIPIDLEATVGCQNWALLQIGEIAALDAWKQRCKRAGNLDVMELVRRATAIKDSLEAYLGRLETVPVMAQEEIGGLLGVFTRGDSPQSERPAGQRTLVTRVWTHAAIIYMFVVVSGWQPTSDHVRYHVSQIIGLLAHHASPPALIRTMVWPLCVAGCLAEQSQEIYLRRMVEALQPPSVFGTAHKALEIMENVWCHRDAQDIASRDLATCFRNEGDLVLLV